MSVVDVRLATVTSGRLVLRPEAAALTVGGLLPLLLAELADLLCRRGQSELVPELTRSKIVDWCECGDWSCRSLTGAYETSDAVTGPGRAARPRSQMLHIVVRDRPDLVPALARDLSRSALARPW